MISSDTSKCPVTKCYLQPRKLISNHTGCFKKSFWLKIAFCIQHLMLLRANWNWFSEEIYLKNSSNWFQTKIWRNNICFWNFVPNVYMCVLFPTIFFLPICRFSYMFVFLLFFSFIFSALSRKWSPKLFVLKLRQIFTVIWPFSQRNF